MIDKINKELAKRLKLSDDTINNIKVLQSKRNDIEIDLQTAIDSNTDDIKILMNRWRDNESNLQRLWGFEENSDYHREFRIPGCSCPKDDNEEFVGTKYRYVSRECPIHGDLK